MSLARAFTTRRVKQSLQLADPSDGVPQRSHTLKGSIGGTIRHKISAPVELIHTTNMLSYNAPDLYPKTASSTASSTKSDDDSDSARDSASSPPTSPDSPFPAKRAGSPEPNHLSCYFTPPGQTMVSTIQTEAPVIPQRAPSHTKKSYDALTRHRSVSRLSEQSSRTVSTKASFSFSRSSSTSTSTSVASHASSPHHHLPKMSSSSTATASATNPPVLAVLTPKPESSESHPFGHELAQVTELAEEYAITGNLDEADGEVREMAQKGLFKFSADDYCGEIQGLFTSFFAESSPAAPTWI